MAASYIPPEILLNIFSNFTGMQPDEPRDQTYWSNIKTLSKCSLVCREWQAFAEPLLYQTYVKPSDDEHFGRRYAPEQSLRNFLRTLLERPALAQNVKALKFGSLGLTSSPNERHVFLGAAFNHFCASEFHRIWKTKHPSNQHDNLLHIIQTNLYAGEERAQFILLTQLLQNIEELYMPLLREPTASLLLSNDEKLEVWIRNTLAPGFTRLRKITMLRPDSKWANFVTYDQASINKQLGTAQ